MPLGSNWQQRRCRKTLQQDFPFRIRDPTLTLEENTGKRPGTLTAPEQTSIAVGPGLNPSHAGQFQTASQHVWSDLEKGVLLGESQRVIYNCFHSPASGLTWPSDSWACKKGLSSGQIIPVQAPAAGSQLSAPSLGIEREATPWETSILPDQL